MRSVPPLAAPGTPATDDTPAVPRAGSRPHVRPVPPVPPARASPPSPFPDDPDLLVENLVRCVVEILAGARELDQVSRWVTEDVYRTLHKRVVLAARARSAHGTRTRRPVFTIGSIRSSSPAAGVIESVVVLHGRGRSRAVAVRLETYDGRWRATAVHVL
ncbi:3-hydroxyacyl-CoA dehydrogenase [Frigoribacterium sp. VKM Ac-2836]|nr:3-hydroxyacyl-CoA dehydrogenase [Frigoribacterium sp. VKM Ac-2836]